MEKISSLALPPNYKPIPVPDAPAISQALLLARALRPLARQVAIGLWKILDETATVERIAKTGVWLPVLKPESELWLDVALVFDSSPSMCLWQRLGMDVYRLLARYGEFRDVRIWRLQHTVGKVELTCRKGILHKPSELLTGDRRRLIVVVSDCVAPAWHDGTMRRLIATWSEKLPVVVFHVFPERLWSRTSLARSVTVELQGKQFGLPNHDLKPFARSVWDRERLQASLKQPNLVRLPVVTLEQDLLSSWARVVAGDRRSRSLGIVWDAQPAKQKSSIQSSSVKDRIDSFLLRSSPLSRDLAALLVSAPVITLPIVRLIKQSMLPHASAVHIAEVLMSGLLKVSGDQTPTFENAERIAYELVDDEVRDRLRAGSLVVEAFDVFEKVSAYVAQGLGKSVNEFWALLRSPGAGKSSEETEFLNAFATVSARILRGLGSEFEAIANSLAPPSIAEQESTKESDFPLEDLEYEVAKLIDFPPLQSCEYESATITAILDRFDFETACFATPDPSPHGNKAYQKLLENYLLATIPTDSTVDQVIEDIFHAYPDPPVPIPSLRLRTLDHRRKVAEIVKDICLDGHLFEILIEQLCERDPQARAVLLEGNIFRRQAVAWGYTEILSRDAGEEIGLDMIAIPGGSFTMGAPESEPESGSDERPQHEVTLQPFYLGRYPITQAQWREVAGYSPVEKDLDPDLSRFKRENRPVERVSWDDAQEFCKRLSARTGKDYRLPSEAEWEYACRAGTETPFHFGETITTELANYDGNFTYNNGLEGEYRYDGNFAYNNGPKGEYRQQTTDVGLFPANEWGLHDVHGNVWEWCEDDYHSSYEGAPDDGSAWVERDRRETNRVLRGGSWDLIPRGCRSANRYDDSRGSRDGSIGFRVCCVPPRALPS